MAVGSKTADCILRLLTFLIITSLVFFVSNMSMNVYMPGLTGHLPENIPELTSIPPGRSPPARGDGGEYRSRTDDLLRARQAL